MLDKSSKPKVTDMSAICLARDEAKRMVFAASSPVRPGESVKLQMRRSAVNLGMDRSKTLLRRHRAAWYGEAGTWGADLLLDLRARYEAWLKSQRHKDAKARLSMADDLDGLAERLSSADPAFFGADIESLRARSVQLRGMATGGVRS